MSSAVAAVLMFHRISEVGADRELLCVPPAKFASLMQYLGDHEYRVIPLEELADGLMEARLPPRAVALTFDDGYLDSLTTAAMILGRYNFPATFFVVTAMHEQPHEFWWDALERALGDECETHERLCLRIQGKRVVLPTTTAAERRTALVRMKRAMYPLCKKERDEIVEIVLRWSGAGRRATTDCRAMTSHEIKSLDDLPGMSVGSHTVNHLLLPAQGREVKCRELVESKRALEALLNREVTTLCYPYGGTDLETVWAAREAGYRCAVSTGNVPVTRASDLFVIPRIAVRAGEDMAARLHGVFGST
jgi:peptidoglycan/xylan/chitin deacetylase (PgdA/CDA1 family)